MKLRFIHPIVPALITLLQPVFGPANPMSAAEGNPHFGAHWKAQLAPPPPLEIPTDPNALAVRQAGIRQRLESLLGNLPPRPSTPQVVVRKREDRGEYWMESFTFDNLAGSEVPGVLLLPKSPAGKVPAILYCHWHGGEYDGGKIELFQQNHTIEPPGPALVRQGFAVIAIDAPCFGERNGRGPDGERGSSGEMSAAKYHLWQGQTLWGMMLRDDRMALDYLFGRPEIDADRIGVTGMSMGATRSWWLMALEPRIRCGVAVACLTRYQDLIGERGLRHHGIYYYVPGMLAEFDTEAVIACIAPRALLCLNGDSDLGSPVSGIREIERKASPAWKILDQPSAFESRIYPKVGHTYVPDMWSRAQNWMTEHLKKRQ